MKMRSKDMRKAISSALLLIATYRNNYVFAVSARLCAARKTSVTRIILYIRTGYFQSVIKKPSHDPSACNRFTGRALQMLKHAFRLGKSPPAETHYGKYPLGYSFITLAITV